MQQLPEALAPMGQYAQFILCRLVPDEKTGKNNKIPYNPHTVQPFKKGENWQEDPTQWAHISQVLPVLGALGPGWCVGFLFTPSDPLFFVDLDSCISNGQWSQVAAHIMGLLPGAAVELSQSGVGSHIFGCYTQMPEHRCKNTALGLEFYHERRFVALTGNVLGGTVWIDHTAAIPSLVDLYFKPGEGAESFEWSTVADPSYTSNLSDDELITRARESKSAGAIFGGVTFNDLWTGNAAVLGAKWPSAKGEQWDGSSADASLAQHLAFWTGNNAQRILDIMEKSALVRDKWATRDRYLENTITNACSMQTKFYSQKQEDATPIEELGDTFTNEPKRTSGYKLMPIDLQAEHFRGCAYVIGENKIYTPGAGLLKQDQFNGTFGGYAFQLDDENRIKPTRKPWEAFFDSHGIAWPRVHDACFLPQEEPGAVINKEGDMFINVYQHVPVKVQEGPVDLFLDHLKRLLPDEHDRLVMLSWMAACVQHKGHKFKWAPFLQGVEGNGKSFLTDCMVQAVGRKHCHLPKADEFGEKFNDWAFGRIFIGVEDVYTSDHKKDVIEILKPLITQDWMPRRAMQKGQEMQDICCNWVLNSNHKDGIRKTRNDRRFAPFFCPQQCEADLYRDGLTPDYFTKLNNWAKQAGGFAAITHYLATYPLEANYNPALGAGGKATRAPKTSSTEDAIVSGLGGIEQEIIEAIDQEFEGFRGGWISSVALTTLLERIGGSRAIPPNKRRALLQTLGYDYHPALRDGKCTRPLDIEGGLRPRLFIKGGHISANITSVSDAIRAYIAAQTDEEAKRMFITNN